MAGPCGAPFPLDVRLGAAAIEQPLQGQTAQEQPLVPCRLVARSMAAGRARQLQAAYGAESLWWL